MNTKNILLGFLIIAVFAVGFAIGRFGVPGSVNNQFGQPSAVNSDVNPADQPSESDTAAIITNMSDAQKEMLSKLGIDPSSITEEMITCAETSLGASRIEEIKNGSPITFAEKVKLLACYK
jgi:hypothetical protein